MLKMPHTLVTAVTVDLVQMRETHFVNMVRRVDTHTLLEPGDTEQQWKGEAAASFVCTGITSGCVLPTSSAGHWSPSITCFAQAPPRRRYPSGVFFCVNAGIREQGLRG